MIGKENINDFCFNHKNHNSYALKYIIIYSKITKSYKLYIFKLFVWENNFFFQINSPGSIQTFCLHDLHQVYVTDKEVFHEFFSLLLRSKQVFHVLAYCTHSNLINIFF